MVTSTPESLIQVPNEDLPRYDFQDSIIIGVHTYEASDSINQRHVKWIFQFPADTSAEKFKRASIVFSSNHLSLQ